MGLANGPGTFVGMRRLRGHALIALLALVCAQGWNRWNIAAMERSPIAVDAVVAGRALRSVDAPSYLQAVDRLLGERPDLEQGPLKDRVDLRAPGYRVWYLLPRLFLEPLPALSVLTWLQCLLYAFAAALLWETASRLGATGWMSRLFIIAFATMPTFHGFLFHTLTEGVTPSLTLIVLCCSLMAGQAQGRGWLLAGLATWSLLLVTRPALVWTGVALLPALRALGGWRAGPLVMLAVLPTLGWWALNSVKAGSPVGLHPVYRADEPGINRPVHGAFWELAKSWGANGDAFHAILEPAFRAAIACDTAAVFANDFVRLAPEGSLTADQREAIIAAFRDWQRFNCTELGPALHSSEGTLRTSTALESRIVARLEALTSAWRSEQRFFHHAVVPMRVLRTLIVHSNLNLFLFQYALRGVWWVEFLRWLSASLHVVLFGCVLLALRRSLPTPMRLIAAGSMLYLLYLAYVQRGVEERYTLPVLFIGVACAAFVAQRFLRANFAGNESIR